MKRVCIHQPDFSPYLGFFHRLLLVDLFIVLDDVQFVRKGGGWHNRDKIKTRNGEKWLTLSTQKAPLGQKINEVLLSPQQDWIEHNLNLLAENYHTAPYFGEYFPRVESIYWAGFTRMVDLNMAFLTFYFKVFDIHVETVFSTDLNILGQSNQRLINLLKKIGGTHYLTGTGSRAYLDERMFEAEGIVVEWQKFKHPVYPQLFGPFIPGLSCLDVLFNCGLGAREVLRSCLTAE